MFSKETQVPTLTLKIIAGKAESFLDWPTPQNAVEAQEMSKEIAALVYLLNTGQLLPVLQQAVANAGQMKGQTNVSQRVLHIINEQMLNFAREVMSEDDYDDNMPLIEADEVFNQGGKQQ